MKNVISFTFVKLYDIMKRGYSFYSGILQSNMLNNIFILQMLVEKIILFKLFVWKIVKKMLVAVLFKFNKTF